MTTENRVATASSDQTDMVSFFATIGARDLCIRYVLLVPFRFRRAASSETVRKRTSYSEFEHRSANRIWLTSLFVVD